MRIVYPSRFENTLLRGLARHDGLKVMFISFFPVFFFQFLLQDRKGKALVEEYDKYENTPLHVAAKKGYVRIVQVSFI